MDKLEISVKNSLNLPTDFKEKILKISPPPCNPFFEEFILLVTRINCSVAGKNKTIY